MVLMIEETNKGSLISFSFTNFFMCFFFFQRHTNDFLSNLEEKKLCHYDSAKDKNYVKWNL